MGVSFYFDHNVPKAVSTGLTLRSVDVLTALEDGRHRASDSDLLDRATELGRVLFTLDDDLLVEADSRRRSGIHFSGLVYGHQLRVSIGQCVVDLEVISSVCELEELHDQIVFLPL